MVFVMACLLLSLGFHPKALILPMSLKIFSFHGAIDRSPDSNVGFL
jgi:hypothetical protein